MYSNVFIHIEGRRLKYANVSCIINLCEWIPFAGFGLTSANGYRLLGSAFDVLHSFNVPIICETIPIQLSLRIG